MERLDDGLAAGHRLTLVSAPAGFGKTTLVSEWVAGRGRPAAWLSLDEGDSDPGRFLAYLVAALSRRNSSAGSERAAHFPGFRPHGGFGSWHFFSPGRALARRRLPLGE